LWQSAGEAGREFSQGSCEAPVKPSSQKKAAPERRLLRREAPVKKVALPIEHSKPAAKKPAAKVGKRREIETDDLYARMSRAHLGIARATSRSKLNSHQPNLSATLISFSWTPKIPQG